MQRPTIAGLTPAAGFAHVGHVLLGAGKEYSGPPWPYVVRLQRSDVAQCWLVSLGKGFAQLWLSRAAH